MKTKLFLFSVVLGTAVILSSCNKPAITSPDDNVGTMNFDQTKSEINALVAKYPVSQQNSSVQNRGPLLGAYALADAGGALEGAGYGVYEGVGGMILGGIIGGIYASSLLGMVHVANGGISPALPPSNGFTIYDQMGNIHNQILSNLVDNEAKYVNAKNQIDTLAVYNFIATQAVSDWNALGYDKVTANEIPSFPQIVSSSNVAIQFANSGNVDLLTNDVQGRFVLKTYLQTVINFKNPLTVDVFTAAYSAIIQQSAIASPTKQGVLVFLAVYEHSFSYWNNK